MNIRELASINIKGLQQIDKDEVIQFVRNRPVIFINIGIVLVSFLISFFIYTSYKNTAKSLKTKIIVLQKKLDAKNIKEATAEDMNTFLGKFPKVINRDEFINQVSAMAFQEGVKIVRITPGNFEENEYLKSLKFNIQITAENFEKLINFIKSIENSKYAIRVQRINSSMASLRRRKSSREGEEEIIQMDVDIVSMELKNALE